MHPPSQWVCGDHPGMGWELNDMLTTNFYRIQIPDPTTKWIIVTPYISFSIQHEHAEVQGTYGKGYPIHNRRLEPIPMDYYCPPFTPDQITLLDATAQHAHALTTVVDEKFPINLSTALRHYQYLKEEQYAAQTKVKQFQECEMRYLEKAVCILSELESANFLGCLIPYEDEILHHLTHDQSTAYNFFRILNTFSMAPLLPPPLTPLPTHGTSVTMIVATYHVATPVAAQKSTTTLRSSSSSRAQLTTLKTSFERSLRSVTGSTSRNGASNVDKWDTSAPSALEVSTTITSEQDSGILTYLLPSQMDYSSPPIHSLFPYAFAFDVFLCASLAQTLYVSDWIMDRDYLLSCYLSETFFIVEDTPHHLIISLPSATLHVCPLSRIFLSHFTMIMPPAIQPQIDAWHHLTCRF